MKKLLSFLLCIVFLQAQVFALVGGPPNTGGQRVDIVGTYSGTMTPVDAVASGTAGPNGESVDSLGLFALGVPAAGPASGTFVIFQQGIIFSGRITAIGDPSKGTLNGLLAATYNYTLSGLVGGVIVTIPVQASVNGVLKASIALPNDFDPTSIASILSSYQRIDGTATVAVDLGNINNDGSPDIVRVDKYLVDGVKQSTTVNTGAALTAPTGG
jgi:hypothetical protein